MACRILASRSKCRAQASLEARSFLTPAIERPRSRQTFEEWSGDVPEFAGVPRKDPRVDAPEATVILPQGPSLTLSRRATL